MKETIQLAGIREIATGVTGDVVAFTFEAQDGTMFRFSCPHEAVGEIVGALEVAAEQAWTRRGSPALEDLVGTRSTLLARRLTGFLLSASPGGVVLSLQTGPLRQHIAMSEQDATRLRDMLAQGPTSDRPLH